MYVYTVTTYTANVLLLIYVESAYRIRSLHFQGTFSDTDYKHATYTTENLTNDQLHI